MPENELQVTSRRSLVEAAIKPLNLPALWEIENVRDVAARAGVLGGPLSQLQTDYNQRLVQALATIERRSSIHEAAALEQKTYLQSRLQENELRRSFLVDEIPRLRGQWADYRIEEVGRQGEIHGLVRSARAARFHYRFTRKDEAVKNRREREIEDFKHQQALAEMRAAPDAERREANREQIERAVQYAEGQLNSVAKLHESAQERSNVWQLRGFTWPVARFLMWASLISLLGIGALAAPIIASRLPTSMESEEGLYHFAQLLGIGQTGNILLAFARFVGLLLMMMALIVGLVFAIRKVIGQLDPKWETKPAPVPSKDVVEMDSEAPWLPFVHFAPPSVTKHLANVNRRTLVQLLASLPVVGAAAFAAFLWMMSASQPTPSHLGGDSFRAIYLGCLYALLCCSSGTLLFFAIIRPAMDGESVRSVLTALYLTLFLLPLGALVSAAVLPTASSALALAILAVAAVTATIGFGHGIYFQGIHQREHALGKLEIHWQVAVAELLRVPTPADYMRREHNKVTLVVHNKSAKPPEQGVPKGFLSLAWWRRRKSDPAPDAVDATAEGETLKQAINHAHLPPEMIESVNAAWSGYLMARTQRQIVHDEIERKQAEIVELDKTNSLLRTEMGRLHSFLVEILDTHDSVGLEVKVEHQEIQEALRDAYVLGAKEAGRGYPENDLSRRQLPVPSEVREK